MTCIVGLVHEGTVYIGGDSAGIEEESLTSVVRADTKVFVLDDFVFGFAGSFRCGQILRYGLEVPLRKHERDLYAYMVTDFVDGVRIALSNGGCLRTEHGVEEIGAGFLVGHAGRLFEVGADLQVGESRLDYAAIGCGDLIALGAMHAMNGRGRPVRKVERALGAAEAFSAGVRGPFVVERA